MERDHRSASIRSPEPADLYAVLGVPAGASVGEIQAAYWRQAASGTADRALLNRAYEVLGSPDRRRAYDAGRRSGAAPPEPQRPAAPVRWGNPGLRHKLEWFLQ